MKLKKLVLMILLILTMITKLWSLEFNSKKTNSENKFNIDSTKNYTADEVEELIDIVIEEAETSIEKSYKEGYKQGVLQFEPEVEYYKTLFEELKKDQQNQNLQITIKSVGIGFAIGSITTLTTFLLLKN